MILDPAAIGDGVGGLIEGCLEGGDAADQSLSSIVQWIDQEPVREISHRYQRRPFPNLTPAAEFIRCYRQLQGARCPPQPSTA